MESVSENKVRESKRIYVLHMQGDEYTAKQIRRSEKFYFQSYVF